MRDALWNSKYRYLIEYNSVIKLGHTDFLIHKYLSICQSIRNRIIHFVSLHLRAVLNDRSGCIKIEYAVLVIHRVFIRRLIVVRLWAPGRLFFAIRLSNWLLGTTDTSFALH